MGRLARSHLVERAAADRLTAVVRDICGIHAQVTSSAELQLAARVDGITREDVRAALWERRELVKTWTLRGTLHLHPADELGLWTAARRAVSPPGDAEIVAAIGDVLRGRRLTREQLADGVVERLPRAPRDELASGWGYHLGDAAVAEILCFGPPEGQRVTFVHVDDWLGLVPRRAWEPAEALREIARRYAATYGPVTSRHFREWIASRDALPDGLELPEPDDAPDETAASVRLLPEYDAYVMAVRDRERLVPPPVRAQVVAHGKGRYEGAAGVAFLLVAGVCAGIWRRRRTARRVELAVEPARPLTRAERARVETEAERIGAFYGLEPVLTIA